MFRGEIVLESDLIREQIELARREVAPGTLIAVVRDGSGLRWIANPRDAKTNAVVLREAIA